MRSRLYSAFRNAFLRPSTKGTSSHWRDVAAVRLITTDIQPLRAGHSKWANIRHTKAAKDQQRALLFLKMARQLRLAIQEGGSADPALNSQLKSAIQIAQRQSMPMATIQQNLKRFKETKSELKKYTVDLQYKQKVFVICTIYTDNYAYLKIEMATVLRKGGAVVVDASHLFEDFGVIHATIPTERLGSIADLDDAVTTDAIECGAEDVELVDAQSGAVIFICNHDIISGVQKLLEDKGYVVDNKEHIYTPLKTVTITPEERVLYQKFVDKLKELPGVEDVHDNIEMQE